MPALRANASSSARTARRNEKELRRSLGAEVRRLRADAGISLRALAHAAGISHSLLSLLEGGDVSASLEVLSRVSLALGGRLAVRIEPGTGPLVRDHIQAAMLQGSVRALHTRWRRFLDVPVYRPVRGSIDLVLDDPTASVAVAGEAHSQLRRLEQQIRWAAAKADALRSGGSPELARVLADRSDVSRFFLLRVTRANREVVATFPDLLQAAYPARHRDAVAALTSSAMARLSSRLDGCQRRRGSTARGPAERHRGRAMNTTSCAGHRVIWVLRP